MDVDRSLLSAHPSPDYNLDDGKENIDHSITPAFTLRTSGVPTHALSPSSLCNRSANSSPERQKPVTTLFADSTMEEENIVPVLKAGRLSTGFAEGVRRESFPRRDLHTMDLSFNPERAGDEAFIGDKSYLSDTAQIEGMSLVYERSSTPIQAHQIPLPPTVQKAGSHPGPNEEARTIRMVTSQTHLSEHDTNAFPFSSPARPEAANASPAASFKSRMVPQRSPLAMEVGAEHEDLKAEPAKPKTPTVGLGFEFTLPEIDSPKKEPRATTVVTGVRNTISSRAAALQFISPGDITELDSIIDVQLPEADDEFTAAFARLKIAAPSKANSAPLHSIAESASPRKWQASTASPERREAVLPHGQNASASSRNTVASTRLSPPPDQINGSYLEDEHTLNIASLGLSGYGNALLVDMSLDQLRSKSNDVEPGDGTFGGASFAITGSSVGDCDEGRDRMLEAKTPQINRKSLPELGDEGMDVEATVKKPGRRMSVARVASDTVVDDLRSGRALHRAVSATSNEQRDFPGSTSSLRRTESLASRQSADSVGAHQRTPSASLQRTQSAVSLYRTSSTTSHRRVEYSRPHSRASAADTDFDDDDDESPYPPSALPVSRISSRRSSVYAYPEHVDPMDPSPYYLERPSSVASIYDRPPSAASIRPSSVASIRPMSATGIRPPTRPTSNSSNRRLSSGTHLQAARTTSDNIPYDDEDDLVRGMEALMMKDNTAKPRLGRTSIAGGVAKGTTRPNGTSSVGSRNVPSARTTVAGSGIRPGVGPNALKKTTSLGPSSKPTGTTSTAAKPTAGTRTLSARSSTIGVGTARPTPATASRATAGLGNKPSTLALRSQPSSAASTLTRSATIAEQPRLRSRASTMGLFAPDGGPGVAEEPKRPTHKPASASISTTSSIRGSRGSTVPSTTRSISRGTVSSTAGPARAAGSIASLRDLKSRETISRR